MGIRLGALPRPQSIKSRITLAVAAVSVLVAGVIAAGLSLLIRHRVETEIFRDTQRVAADWIGAMGHGVVPAPVPTSRVPLVQLIDQDGRVVAAGPMSGEWPLSTAWPPAHDRYRNLTECSDDDRCVMLTAARVPDAQAPQGRPHVVYAGTDQPPALRGHRLEMAIGAAGALLAVLWTWTTWRATGRILRPITAIRQSLSEITDDGLTLRVPQPPGEDEFALLARTCNQTLDRLETAVSQQRRFASLVSHELRSPLCGLRTALEEALLYPDVDARQAIEEALPVTGRMQEIIDDLLAFARVRGATVPYEPVDLGGLLLAEAEARTSGVPVHVRAEEGLRVLGNPIQLASVVTNLLVNAQRHAASRVDATAVRAGDEVLVTVLDDGDGIAPADRERVFEPFVRLDEGIRRDQGGSGLGLALSRAIAVAHHGSLRIEESPRGAWFVLRLPVLVEPRAPSPFVPGRANQTAG